MPARTARARLTDIVDAAERIRDLVAGMALEEFERDWKACWLVERGILIISEASRHLPGELKSRHPGVPWRKIADIGNILRHAYEAASAPLLLGIARGDLRMLAELCRDELSRLDNSE